MSRPPRARDAVLDAYERVLGRDGERAATMDAVSREAGVSKGGLLYHFASKEALEAALIARLEQLCAEDVAALESADEGIVRAFVRSSQLTGSALDHTIIAVTRLAQNGHDEATAALRRVRAAWEDAVRPHVRDDTALQLVMLVSDGLYFNSGLSVGNVPGPDLDDAQLAALIDLVERTAAG